MARSWSTLLALVLFGCIVPIKLQQRVGKNDLLVRPGDFKEFKKLMRTKTNLLVVFAKSEKTSSQYYDVFVETAQEMKGKAALAFIDCSELKKLCKKLKAAPFTVELKHYKDGDYNREYDRKMTVKSMINFLQDPTGDIPWDEEPDADDVIHIDSEPTLTKLLKKQRLPMLLMFYAPWCGFCKRLKPEFAAAASYLKGRAILAGVDVDKPNQWKLRMTYNITGFPTLYYFEKGKVKFRYGGENSKDGIIKWMKQPEPPSEPKKESEWSEEKSDVVHLSGEDFDGYIQSHSSVLVMFYAPWCGHCKKMKPEYAEAAATVKTLNIDGVLAAVDSTKETKLSERFKVQGFPTALFIFRTFVIRSEACKIADYAANVEIGKRNGEFSWNIQDRTAEKLVEFLKNPKEPPPPPVPEPQWEEIESDVTHLTKETFKSFLRKKKHTLVMYYAPWCGHCKKAKPEFMNAASKFKDDSKVSFSALDCTKYTSVCTAHEVTGYPTFKYFNYGKNPQKYMGGREEIDFVAFMQDPLNTGTASANQTPTESPEQHWLNVKGHENIHILTDKMFDLFTQTHGSVLVMFYAPWCGHCKSMKPAFGEAASLLKEQGVDGVLAAVDATTEQALANRFNIRGYPTLKYFKNGVFKFDYEEGRMTEEIVAFIKNPQAITLKPAAEDWSTEENHVNFLNTLNFDQFISEHSPVLVMFYAPWCNHCKKMKPAYIAAALRLKKELPLVRLAAVDATRDVELAKRNNVQSFPVLKYFESGKEISQYSGGQSEEDLIAFMKNPTEASPTAQPAWSTIPSAVNHLTKENFSTFTTEKDAVLVMFYTPWCAHCKNAKLAFQNAADTMKDDDRSYRFAAVDCTSHSNLCKNEEVNGYPTFKLYSYGRFVSEYQGGRSKQEFIDFAHSPPRQREEL